MEESLLGAGNLLPAVLTGKRVPELDGNPKIQPFDILRALVGTGEQVWIFSKDLSSLMVLVGKNALGSPPTAELPNLAEEGLFNSRGADYTDGAIV